MQSNSSLTGYKKGGNRTFIQLADIASIHMITVILLYRIILRCSYVMDIGTKRATVVCACPETLPAKSVSQNHP